jgi:uncharacterized protein DUF4177
MSALEYKVILLPYKPSIFQPDSTDIHDALNVVGKEGWKLSQIIEPSSLWGRSNNVIAILERPLA